MCRSGDEDHPRRCGENACRLAKSLFVHGSPPRMRGKPNSATRAVITCRITPAGAGKTEGVYLFAPPKEDHPRRCGENIVCGNSDYNVKGSPPQVRGKLAASVFFTASVGITPAGAGKTITLTAWTLHSPGSPPQVRGKPQYVSRDAMPDRITPAGAGKTLSGCRITSSYADHPRRCGENFYASVVLAFASGSPPQVRGKLPKPARLRNLFRITPAGAGKTCRRGRCSTGR